jgi:hypothetical protein
MFGMTSSSTTWPGLPVMSPPTPTSCLPVGHVAVTALLIELDALVATTRSSPATGLAQTAWAVTLQLPPNPLSSSSPDTVTVVSAALGRMTPITTCPAPPVISPPAPSTCLPAGQVTVGFLLDEFETLTRETRSSPGGGVAQIA